MTTAKKKPAATQKAKAKPGATPRQGMSLLDAAAKILKQKNGKGMTTAELVDAAAKAGLWVPMSGKTPASTLYSSILREIATKGRASRFAKTDRGMFGWKTDRVEPKDGDGAKTAPKGTAKGAKPAAKPAKPAGKGATAGKKPVVKPATPKPATPGSKPKPTVKKPPKGAAPEPETIIPQSDEFTSDQSEVA